MRTFIADCEDCERLNEIFKIVRMSKDCTQSFKIFEDFKDCELFVRDCLRLLEIVPDFQDCAGL